MADKGNIRRLAAILAADVVDYSRLMHEDENATIAAWQEARREIIEPIVAEHEGRIVKHTGDGFLAEFSTVQPAVLCAVALQEKFATGSLAFRMGVNLGEIVADETDIHGDGVNIAARLEGLADPGGICISGAAVDQVHNKLDLNFIDLGEQELKNIARPVRVFKVNMNETKTASAATPHKTTAKPKTAIAASIAAVIAIATGLFVWQPWVTQVERASVEKMAFKLPDRPSIAVLPFSNLSDDKDQDFFADGITEDIITDLSKVSGLFVVARNSTFTYKGKPVEIRKVAEDLGVRYVLKGSVRRSGDRVRINVQLIDAIKGFHIWAERYDRELKDVFAVQNEVNRMVVSELAVTLKTNEQERLYRSETGNLEAYETFLRARRLRTPTRESEQKAKKLFERVIELDPDFAGGHAGLAFIAFRAVFFGFTEDRKAEARRALDFARTAFAKDEESAWTLLALGGAYLVNRDFDKAISTMQDAVALHPNNADVYTFQATYLHWAGRGDEAVEAMKVAMRLDPKQVLQNAIFVGFSYFTAKRYADAIKALRPGFAIWAPKGQIPLTWLAASYAGLGQMDEAREALSTYMKKHPKVTAKNFSFAKSYKRPEDRDRLIGLLIKAGMPEK